MYLEMGDEMIHVSVHWGMESLGLADFCPKHCKTTLPHRTYRELPPSTSLVVDKTLDHRQRHSTPPPSSSTTRTTIRCEDA